MKKLLSLISLTLLMSACSSNPTSEAEQIGRVMGEVSCLIVNDPTGSTAVEEEASRIFAKNGYDAEGSDVETYLSTVSEDLQPAVQESFEASLEANCAEGLKTAGVAASTLAESILGF